MSEIRSEDWGAFTSAVADAVKAGSDIQILTDSPGEFVATVDGGPEEIYEYVLEDGEFEDQDEDDEFEDGEE